MVSRDVWGFWFWFYFLKIKVYVCALRVIYHSLYIEVNGQLAGINSLLPPYG